MKNLCFFNTVRFWGGGEKLHLEYALKFKEKNYRVYLASEKNSPLSQKGESAGLPVFKISVRNLSFLNPVKYLKLIRFFKKEKIDTVIFSTSHDVKLGALSAKLAGVRNIVYIRVLAVPVKNTIINRLLFNQILTHIVANSLETKRTILKNLNKTFTEDKVKVIYQGIDLNVFDKKTENKRDELFQKRNGIILGNAGRLTAQKGQHHLIEIAKRLKLKKIEFTLFIAGTGEMQSALEKLITQYNLQNEVVLLGFVQDTENFMRAIDIFILTSVWEGFGFVIVEAMAANKPVIAFDITSNPEIIINKQTGFLVDYPDLEMMCEKIELLIKDDALRIQFGKAGRETVEKKFQFDDKITEFERYLLNKKMPEKI